MAVVPANPAVETIDQRVSSLLASWREQTAYVSSSTIITGHPAYQALIDLGPSALAALFRDLKQTEDGHLSKALTVLTGAHPVPAEDRGKIRKVAEVVTLGQGEWQSIVEGIAARFSGLRTSPFRITSPATRDYNCIAWAAGDAARWWWPDPDPENDAIFWPSTAPMAETVEAFVAAFATQGYGPASGEGHESGFEKVALFATDGVPTHASRQLPSGRWTSKLGKCEDIEHDLHAVSGTA